MLYLDATQHIRFASNWLPCYTAGQFEGENWILEDLLTTKQLQELLQVDRITIYRMLGDGRLRGFKVGGQWRFSRQEIEGWLQEQVTLGDGRQPSSGILPLSCVSAIQGICAEALNVAAVTVDLDGTPLTDVNNSCDFCSAILVTAEGRRRCSAAWKNAGDGQVHTCHAGLSCLGALIRVGNERVAIAATCQFAEEGWRPDLSALARDLGLKAEELGPILGSVRGVQDGSLDRVSRFVKRMADTFSEIGQERLELLSRLRHIAQVSTI
ncbi:MAG: helix-turn-helix domain-containing protein [Planctomycetaceae bacterium]|nr:MAG: helix-turn-helix domain-containing protein [Planctomycetaceae bacterium]